MSQIARTLMLAAVTTALFGAPARAQSDGIVKPDGGAAMCSALKPADFAQVGLSVSDANGSPDDDGASVYCTYPSPAGKIELDVFYGASTTAANAIKIEGVTLSNVGAQFKSVQLTGADDAQMGSGGSGANAFTSIVFRLGTAVFSLGIPASARAHDQLLALARVAMGRIHRT